MSLQEMRIYVFFRAIIGDQCCQQYVSTAGLAIFETLLMV